MLVIGTAQDRGVREKGARQLTSAANSRYRTYRTGPDDMVDMCYIRLRQS